MTTSSSLTDAVIVDHGKVVMRVSSNVPNGETVRYSPRLSHEAINDASHIEPSNSKRGRISRASIYVGNAQLMAELPYGYCELEEVAEVVNQ